MSGLCLEARVGCIVVGNLCGVDGELVPNKSGENSTFRGRFCSSLDGAERHLRELLSTSKLRRLKAAVA